MKNLSLIALLLASSLTYAQSSSYSHQNASAASAFDDLDDKPAPVAKVEPKPAPVKNVTIIHQKIVHVHQAAPTPEPTIVEVAAIAPSVQEVPQAEPIIHVNYNKSLCQKIKQEHPNADSGKHFVPVANNKEMEFFCEMELDGGGWTAIWTGQKREYRTKDYSYDVPLKYIKEMKEVVIGYVLDGNIISAVKFNKPKEWNYSHPFTVQGSDVRIDAVNIINGHTYKYKLLRYGYAGFAESCNDKWNNDRSNGRLCITNTDAPFYAGFSYFSADKCSFSNSKNPAACQKKRFVILGR